MIVLVSKSPVHFSKLQKLRLFWLPPTSKVNAFKPKTWKDENESENILAKWKTSLRTFSNLAVDVFVTLKFCDCDESNYFIGRIQLSNTIILLAYMLDRRSVNDERGQVFISFLFINVVVYLALSLTKMLQSLLWLGVPFFYYERAVKLGYYTKDKPKRYQSGGSPSKSSSFMVDTIAHKRRVWESLKQKIRKKVVMIHHFHYCEVYRKLTFSGHCAALAFSHVQAIAFHYSHSIAGCQATWRLR